MAKKVREVSWGDLGTVEFVPYPLQGEEEVSDDNDKMFQSENPLYHPRRYGEEFAKSFYEIRDKLHAPDPTIQDGMRIAIAATELLIASKPAAWVKEELFDFCLRALAGQNALPPRSKANKFPVSQRQIEELLKDWRHRYPTVNEARRAVVRYLERPLCPHAVKELVALVAPMSRNKWEAKEWVAEYLGRSWGRVNKLSRKDSH